MTWATSDLSLSETFRSQRRVLAALILRDIKTRFGGSDWGFLIAVLWPLSHIVLLLVVNTGLGRSTPYGESSALFFATGVVPFMAYNYMARFIMLGVVLNKPMLAFPVVKVPDIMFARVIIEFLNSSLIVIIVIVSFWVLGIDFMPSNVVQAGCALLSMMLLGIGFGILNAVIAAVFPFWVTGYALLSIALWMASGVLFVPDALPTQIQDIFAYLPPLQGVEWMRSAYYTDYGARILDKWYLLSWGVGSIFLGLLIERLARGKILT